jgi:hypothetical protein
LKALLKISVILVVHLVCFQQLILAQDTLYTERPEKPARRVLKGDPTRATMLAVAFPGLGQLYNRKYWKVPFVYAGFGGLIYAVTYNATTYNTYLKAYQDFTDLIPKTDSYLTLLKNADPVRYDPVLHPDTYNISETTWYEERMLKGIDYYKKYRDLSYIGFGLWYILTILDANVDASLLNYDISDDLNLEVTPVQMPLSTSGQTGVGLSMSLRVTF